MKVEKDWNLRGVRGAKISAKTVAACITVNFLIRAIAAKNYDGHGGAYAQEAIVSATKSRASELGVAAHGLDQMVRA